MGKYKKKRMLSKENVKSSTVRHSYMICILYLSQTIILELEILILKFIFNFFPLRSTKSLI